MKLTHEIGNHSPDQNERRWNCALAKASMCWARIWMKPRRRRSWCRPMNGSRPEAWATTRWWAARWLQGSNSGISSWRQRVSRPKRRYFLLNPLRPRLSRRRYAPAPVSATSPLGVLTHAKGEAGHGPSGWSPHEMRGSRFLDWSQFEISRAPHIAARRAASASFLPPLARSAGKGEGVTTKCRRNADLSCDGWG